MEKMVGKISLMETWVSATSAATSIGVLAIFWKVLPPQVPLWYSRPWGRDQLAEKAWLWIITGVLLAISVFAIMAHRKLKNDPVLTIIVLSVSVIAQLVLILALLRVVILIS